VAHTLGPWDDGVSCALPRPLQATFKFIEIFAVNVPGWVWLAYRSMQSRCRQQVELLPCKLPQEAGGVIARYVSHSLPVCKPVALRAAASNALLLVHSFQQAAYGVGTSTWHVGVGQRWWVSVNYNIRYMILWFLTCIKFCNLRMSRRALCWPSVFH
jgi:hypothetical protein